MNGRILKEVQTSDVQKFWPFQYKLLKDTRSLDSITVTFFQLLSRMPNGRRNMQFNVYCAACSWL